MARDDTLERSAAVLVPAIVLLLGVGIVAAAGRVRDSAEEASPPTTAADWGALERPAPGTYTYEVTSGREGATGPDTETRIVRPLEGRPGEPNVEITTVADGQRQVARLVWSSSGALVRSTTVATGEASGAPCTWEPPFPEVGALEEGASWTVASTCTTEIDGFATTIEVDGRTEVRGSTVVDVGDRRVAVLELERDRSTRVVSSVGDDALDQTVREAGTLYLDPTRGLIVRSEVRVTVSGARAEEYDRRSVLVDAAP